MEPSKRRSSHGSMSESDCHSSVENNSSTPPDSPGLISEFNLERSVSNPDFNCSWENIVDPIGVGLGTRLQARQKDGKEEQLARTLQRVEYLKKDVEGWEEICTDSPLDLFVIYASYERLQNKRKIVAREALLRGADMRVVREIEGLGTRMDIIKRLAEKRYQRQGTRALGNLQPSIMQGEDEVFNEEEGLEGRTARSCRTRGRDNPPPRQDSEDPSYPRDR